MVGVIVGEELEPGLSSPIVGEYVPPDMSESTPTLPARCMAAKVRLGLLPATASEGICSPLPLLKLL